DVIRFADHSGDSLILSQKAAAADKKHIIFCGVYFMAECADILTSDDQSVHLPDSEAGCAMADMATREDVERVWRYLQSNTGETIIPVTYINSSAEIKAFVGKNNGIICTSSNASRVFDWAMERGSKILFLPDQFLGMNTALRKGISQDHLFVLKELPDAYRIKRTSVFLWNGYCSVHKCFTPADVTNVRERYPDIRIIVHGECTPEVVQGSDHYGSTSAIIKHITEAEKGSIWAIGTEQHLVRRLQQRFPDKTILPLAENGFQCTTMSMITPESLLAVLEAIQSGSEKHIIRVDNEIKFYAKTALMRMLEL
ncbi:MAG: quinolinate synthase NadA, partial [FCB group bacterium]|nr:quinolinate synthase NadA [FCB group bacterium]